MGDNLYRTFGLLIAQVLPGLILVLGFSPHVPLFGAWLGAAATQDITVGSAAMVLLASIAAGLVLSGARAVLFETLLNFKRGDASGPALESAAAVNDAVTAAQERIHVQHYAYYQFYGSTFIALPIAVALAVGWPATPFEVGAVVGTAVVELVLYVATVDAMRRFLAKRQSLVKAAR